MSTPNPGFYTVGGPVQAGSGVYVLRKADGELLALCKEGTFAYVLTARQMGKSSLMVRTAERLADDGIVSVIVDLQVSGKLVSVDQWYLNFLVSLEEALDEQDIELDTQVRKWWQENRDLGPSKRFSLFMEQVLLAEVTAPIVIFVDEIDTTLGIDFTDDFFVAIRYFAVSRAVKPVFKRLSFVLIGVATPGNLIQDRQRTPFNVGQRVDLTDFTLAEVGPLAAGLGLPQLEAEKVMEWVMGWTGGHPYLTQQLCRALAESSEGEGQVRGWTKRAVDDAVAATFFGLMAERDNNLQFVRGMLTESDHEIYDVLTTYRDVWAGRQPVVDDEQSLIKSHLKLSGVVKREVDKTLRVRNGIYARVFDGAWVRDNLPVNWRKRIRQLQGTIAASLLVMGGLSGLATWALVERARAQSESDRAESYLVDLEAQNEEIKRQRDIATTAADNAKRAAIRALAAEGLAEKERDEAEVARQQAEEAKAIEAEQRLLAEQRQLEAEQAEQAETVAREAETSARQNAEERRLQAEAATQVAEEQSKIALGRQLAAQSEITRGLRGNLLPTSILLAIESSQRLIQAGTAKNNISRGEADSALRNYTLMAPEIARLSHDAEVRAVSFSPDGHTVATASLDATARLWDSQSGQEIAVLNHNENVNAVSFSPDGHTVATASLDATARLWDSQSGQEIAVLNHNENVRAVSFSPDGHTVATASLDATARLWDSQSGQEIAVLNHNENVNAVSFSPDGRYVATASADNTARVWDSQSGQEIAVLNHDSEVWAVSFSPDGRTVATASWDNTARLWDSQSGQEIAVLNHDANFSSVSFASGYVIAAVNAVSFSPDGRTVATASGDNTARLWDSQSGQEILRLNHDSYVNAVSFSPDGRTVTTASWDDTARVWDSQSGQEIAVLNHDSYVMGVSFSPDGRTVATASWDDTARVWDSQSGQEIAVLNHDSYVMGVSFSPDGRMVATASADNTARVWDSQSGQEIAVLNHDAEVWAVSFSPDGRTVVTATGDDDTARVWGSQSGQEIAVLNHNENVVTAVSFSPDGRTVATASWDATARVWDSQSGQEIAVLNHNESVTAVSFSPDGRYVATASSDATARVWDSQSGQEIARLNHDSDVIAVSFSPDRRYVATASRDTTARVWDSQSGQEIARLNHDASVVAVSFSPNGRYIATASGDGTAEVRYVFTENVIAQACQRLTSNMTVKDWQRYINEDSSTYQKTCPNLPYPIDYPSNYNLSKLSSWIVARVDDVVSMVR